MMKIREEIYYFKFYEEQNIKQTIVYKTVKRYTTKYNYTRPFQLRSKIIKPKVKLIK